MIDIDFSINDIFGTTIPLESKTWEALSTQEHMERFSYAIFSVIERSRLVNADDAFEYFESLDLEQCREIFKMAKASTFPFTFETFQKMISELVESGKKKRVNEENIRRAEAFERFYLASVDETRLQSET